MRYRVACDGRLLTGMPMRSKAYTRSSRLIAYSESRGEPLGKNLGKGFANPLQARRLGTVFKWQDQDGPHRARALGESKASADAKQTTSSSKRKIGRRMFKVASPRRTPISLCRVRTARLYAMQREFRPAPRSGQGRDLRKLCGPAVGAGWAGLLAGGAASSEPSSGSDGVAAAGDQPRAPLEAEIGPGPFPEDLQAVAEADQKKDVDEQPRQPGDKAGDVDAADSATAAARPMVASVPLSR